MQHNMQSTVWSLSDFLKLNKVLDTEVVPGLAVRSFICLNSPVSLSELQCVFCLSSTRHSGIHVSVCIHVLPCKISHHNTNDDDRCKRCIWQHKEIYKWLLESISKLLLLTFGDVNEKEAQHSIFVLRTDTSPHAVGCKMLERLKV